MTGLPWVAQGREAVVVDVALGDLKGKSVTVRSLVEREGCPFPDVAVRGPDGEAVLRPWQLVEKGTRPSHAVRRLAPGVTLLEWQGYENNANSVLLGERGTVIVDSGHLHLLGSLLAALGEAGVSPGGFEAALYTHTHPDHYDSAPLFAAAGAAVGLDPREDAYMRGDGAFLYRFMGVKAPQVTPSVQLAGKTGTVGGLELALLHTPGHSPGSVCLFLRESGALCCGDVIFAGGAFGRCDFPGGDYRTLLESFAAFDGLEIEHLVPGHGPAVSGAKKVTRAIEESRGNLRGVVFGC